LRHVQIIPRGGFNIYGALVKKERSLRTKKKGTWRRSTTGKWTHKNFYGWVNFKKGLGNILHIEVRSKVPEAEWALLEAFIGFVDRHFAKKISAINIQYAAD